MQSKPKTNSVITHSFNAETNVILFTVLGEGEVRLDLNKVSAANSAHAALHGWLQRVPDAAAIGQADAEGDLIPEADRRQMKFEKMQALCAHYETGTGEWNMARTAGGAGGSRSITIEAIASVKGIEYAEAERLAQVHADMHFAGDLKKALAFLRTGTKVRDAISAIRAERSPAKGMDADAALEVLKGE